MKADMRYLAQLALRGYKRWLSPMLPAACRYVPTCSEYAEEAIERHGLLRGGAMALWRLLRCNPFGGSGWDPVVKTPTCKCIHLDESGSVVSAADAQRFVSRQPIADNR